MKLLDTTVAIDHLRGVTAATDLLRSAIEEDETIAASELVRFELLAGIRNDEHDRLEDFFAVLSWIPVDEPIARTAGLLACKHRAAHSGIDDVDYLIAASALVLDAELLTTNRRHFPMLPNLSPAY